VRKHRTLLTATVLLAFAFSAVPAAAAPANQVPGEKKYCLSTKASHVFLNASTVSGPTQLKYTVTVAPKVCLLYTNVKNTVSGKSVTQPLVHGYIYEARVSHSGSLPADASGKVILPKDYNLTAAPVHVFFDIMNLDMVDRASDGRELYDYNDYSSSNVVKTGGADAWASLVETGFKCSKGKCRPVKSSALETFSSVTPRLDGQARYTVFLSATVATPHRADPYASVRGSTVAFWDHGTAPMVEAGVSRPQNSFKRDTTWVGGVSAFCGPKVFLGVPAANRNQEWC